jgi:hypothetical protein
LKLTKTLLLNHRVNLIGLASSLLLFYTALSNRAWWVVRGGSGGEYTFLADVSPFNIVLEVLGRPVTIPIIPYLCLAARLSILLAATTIFVGSLLAGKTWSKPMMSLNGLVLPIIFIFVLYTGLSLAKLYIGVSIPMYGESTLNYLVSYRGSGVATETPVTASLTEEYWIAFVAGTLSALARIVHSKPAPQER